MDDKGKRPTYQPREAVLVVMHADGWVEVFAEKNVVVHIATFPCVYSAKVANAAEQYVELMMPWRYRKLYWPVKLRAADTVRKATLEDIGLSRWRKKILAVMTRITKRIKRS